MAGEERLRSIRKLVDDAQKALDGLDADERDQRKEEFGRLDSALGYLAVVLERTVPELLTDGAHAELTRLLEQVAGNPTSVAANPASYADGLITQVAQLPAAQNRDLEQAAKEAASSFRRSAAQHLHAVGEEAEQLRAQLAEIAAASDQAQQEAKQSSEASTSELRSQLESIHASATTAQQQIEDLAASHGEAFEEEQVARAKRSEEAWSGTREEIQTEAGELVADLARMRSQAQGLVGAVGAASTANHFRDDAKRERISYWTLLALTVLSLSGAVVVAALAAAHPETEIQRLITKMGVSAALIAFAVFTGSRARDHRAREQVSQDKELDMRAFGPFIEPLPPKEQVRERILMARRFFGRTEPDAPARTEEEIQLLSSPEEIDIAARDLRQHDRA